MKDKLIIELINYYIKKINNIYKILKNNKLIIIQNYEKNNKKYNFNLLKKYILLYNYLKYNKKIK